MGSQTPSPIGKCPLLQVNSKKYTAAKVGKENYTRVTERSLNRKISQKWDWHIACTPLLTHEWETYMALEENIYGTERIYMEDRENVYGTYMEHKPLLTAGQEMDHWARNHDGGAVVIVVETTMLQF